MDQSKPSHLFRLGNSDGFQGCDESLWLHRFYYSTLDSRISCRNKWYQLEYPTHFLMLIQCQLLKLMLSGLCGFAWNYIGGIRVLMIYCWLIAKSHHIVTHYMTCVAVTNNKTMKLYQHCINYLWIWHQFMLQGAQHQHWLDLTYIEEVHYHSHICQRNCWLSHFQWCSLGHQA